MTAETPPVEKVTLVCCITGETVETTLRKNGKPKTPRLWKIIKDKAYSPSGLGVTFRTSAITVRVAKPLSVNGNSDLPPDKMWKRLQEALEKCWSASTNAANAIVAALGQADYVRMPGMAKPPDVKLPYAAQYPLVRQVCPELDTGSASAIAQSVLKKYKAKRYEIRWLRKSQMPTYRYPYPYPVRAQEWRMRQTPNGDFVVLVPLLKEKWELLLAGGKDFWRQLAGLKKVVAGAAVSTELSLYPKDMFENGDGDHRKSIDGPSRRKRLMCKIVARFPLPAKDAAKPTKVFHLKTTGESFLYGWIDKEDRYWVINADHVRRWIVGRNVQRQREREDLKYEKRWPRKQRQARIAEGRKHDRKQRNRIESFVKERAMWCVNYALRAKCTELHYNDEDHSFFGANFPWAEFLKQLQSKCSQYGLTFIHNVKPAEGAKAKRGKGKKTKGEQAAPAPEEAIELDTTEESNGN